MAPESLQCWMGQPMETQPPHACLSEITASRNALNAPLSALSTQDKDKDKDKGKKGEEDTEAWGLSAGAWRRLVGRSENTEASSSEFRMWVNLSSEASGGR